jgi:nucleoid-associated protein YgaU
MGSVQHAVLEFDASVRAPWRPLLGSGGTLRLVEPLPPSTSAEHGPGPARGSAGRAPLPAGAPARRPAPRPGGRPPAARVPGGRAVRGGGCASPDRRPAAPLRLTHRGRRLVAALVLGGGVVLASWLGPLVTGGAGDLRLTGADSVVVRPGDTLWSIASTVAGTEADVRGVVDRIQELNGLAGSELVPGQVLELP